MKPTKTQEKYNRRQRRFQNKRHKPFASKKHPSGKGVIPVTDKCIKCGKNTTNHHILCNRCWKKNNAKAR